MFSEHINMFRTLSIDIWQLKCKQRQTFQNDQIFVHHPSSTQIIVHRCQIAAPRCPTDISSAADYVFFKNREQNIECSICCVASSTVLLKPNVANILLFNFCEQKFVQHGPITIAIANYASGPKSAPSSDSFWVRRLFNVCARVFCAPNATILLVYIPAKIKMSFIWKDDFFFTKIRIFCKSICRNISQRCSSVYIIIFVWRKDKTNYLSNQTWAKYYHSRNKH